MPIIEKTAYLLICDKCGCNANPEWTRFDKNDLINDDLKGYDAVAQYNEKTGIVYCYDCLQKYPELIEPTEDERENEDNSL